MDMLLRRSVLALVVVVLAVSSLAVLGSNADNITVNYEVQAINEIDMSAAAVTLTISAASAGSQPTDYTDNSTATYAITTNAATDGKKLTAAIDTNMPAGVTLSVTLAAPTGGSSAGEVAMTSTAADVVTLIDAVAESGLTMTFKLASTVSAGVVASAAKTLTLTLTDTI